MPRLRKRRVCTPDQGGLRRYYGDFPDFGDVGGSREALIPKGAERATTDEKLAQALAAERIGDLETRRRRKQRREPEDDTYLAPYVAYHMVAKSRSRRWAGQWLESVEMHLIAAIEFFCNGGKALPRGTVSRPCTGTWFGRQCIPTQLKTLYAR